MKYYKQPNNWKNVPELDKKLLASILEATNIRVGYTLNDKGKKTKSLKNFAF